MNLHRIGDLAERFVFFNDDMFLLRPVGPDFFFRRGLPRLPADLGYPRRVGFNNSNRTVFNDYALLHQCLDVPALLRRHAPMAGSGRSSSPPEKPNGASDVRIARAGANAAR